MPLTKTELLIPRVLCIGGRDGEPNYPGSPYKSGDILEVVDYFILIDDICSKLIYNEVTNAYPELFRPLPWWYGRKPEEMPEYVKCVSGKLDGRFFKVLSPSQNGRHWHDDNEIEHCYFIRYASNFVPADKSDYQEYQKQKEAK